MTPRQLFNMAKHPSHICIMSHEISRKTQYHWHDFYEFELVLEGHGRYHLNNSYYDFKEGTIFFMTPADVHEYIFDEATRVLHMSFSENCFEEYGIDGLIQPYMPLVCDTDNISYKNIKFLIESIYTELYSSNAMKKKAVTHYLSLLLIEIYRRTKSDSPFLNSDLSSVTQAALNYIHLHFRQDIKFTDVAAYVKCSPEHLSRQFNANLKMNFRQYLNTTRIRFSKSLLKYTSESVSDIGYYSGFNSDAQFSKTFSSITGVTPSKYRAEHYNKESTNYNTDSKTHNI